MPGLPPFPPRDLPTFVFWILVVIIAVVGPSLQAQQDRQWVLAVYDASGLVFSMVYETEAACHLEGQAQVRRLRGASYRCAPRRIYKPQ